MRLFIFARHAESDSNTAGVLNSDPADRVGLSRHGLQQARLLGEQLAYLQIDQAVCSRFLRTRQTSELAISDRRIPIRIDADLDEVDAGVFDGRPITDYWQWKEHHRSNERFPGGESLEAAIKRYAVAVRRLLGRQEQTTLIVCHELALRSILAAASNTTQPRSHSEVANAVPYLLDELVLRRALRHFQRSERPSAQQVDAAAA
jgi:probable phosphoglycerate mutase